MDWHIAGHDWAVNMLQKHLDQGRLRHAYLFSGPRGIGRRTMALRFIQAINCDSKLPDGSACGECRICRQTLRMEHPDLSIVRLEEDNKSILVEQIRDLTHILSRSPFEAQYRVGLLLNFDQATESAQNALLKTLEEAPSRVILLLTVDTIESMLPTIVSRCEVMRLRAMNPDQLENVLTRKYKIAAEQASILAHISGGRMGEALRLGENPKNLEARKQWLDELIDSLYSDRNIRMDYAEKKFRHGGRDVLRTAGQIWMTFWRDVILRAAGEKSALLNPDYEDEVMRLADSIGLQSAREQASSLREALERLEANVNTWMLSEILLLDLPQLSR